MRVFDSNTPPFFHPSERAGFEHFLDAPDASYLVMDHDSEIVGCGGFGSIAAEGFLCWGMIRQSLHRQGLGRYLLLYRLREIGKSAGIETVRLETSQFAAGFFEKQGFRVAGATPDGYAPGFDQIVMYKKMTVCP